MELEFELGLVLPSASEWPSASALESELGLALPSALPLEFELGLAWALPLEFELGLASPSASALPSALV